VVKMKRGFKQAKIIAFSYVHNCHLVPHDWPRRDDVKSNKSENAGTDTFHKPFDGRPTVKSTGKEFTLNTLRTYFAALCKLPWRADSDLEDCFLELYTVL